MPTVSVIIPTYNRAALLPRAINSVRTQSLTDLELIIVNDASTDDTINVVKKIQAQDQRIKLITNTTNNYPDISKTLNTGIASATGEFIARLDDDDYWCDADKLKKQTAFLQAHPDHALVGSGMIVVDENDQELYRFLKPETDAQIRARALLANPFAHTAVMYRTSAVRAVGGYSNIHYAEDWDLWLKLGEQGKFHNLPEYLTKYLQAGQNKSLVHQKDHTRAIFGILKTHRNCYPHFYKAYAINLLQYLYAICLPYQLRALLHPLLSSLKR